MGEHIRFEFVDSWQSALTVSFELQQISALVAKLKQYFAWRDFAWHDLQSREGTDWKSCKFLPILSAEA